MNDRRCTRRAFLRGAAAGAAAMGFGWTARGAAAKRPNIVFLLSDDQRWDTIRALGNPDILTPNLDRLVARGTAFTRACIMGGSQGAVCMPSRAMIHTARTLFHVGPTGEIPEDAPLMGEVFRKAGYAVAGIGKWHNGAPAFARSFDGGGPVFFGGMSDQFNVRLQDFDPTGAYPAARAWMSGAKPETKGRQSSEVFTDAALAWLDRAPADRPFFLYVAYTSPHDPRTAPPEYHRMYDPAKIPLPPNFLPQHPFPIGDDRIRDEMLAPFPRTPEVVRQHTADYYAMITHLDAQVGRILDRLREKGLEENTIVVFTGDNGLAVGRHGLFGKQNVYEHAERVPLVLAGPGVPAGRRDEALCYLLDLFPSLCDLSGVPAPSGLDGLSLAPVLAGTEKSRRAALCYAYRHFARALRTDRWRLMLHNSEGKRVTQLFDVTGDPWETKNLADDPAQAERVKEMTAQLQKLLAEAGDTADVSKPDFGLAAAPARKAGAAGAAGQAGRRKPAKP